MNKQQALQWEATWARPAAFAAFVAAVLLVAQIVLLQTVIEDRPGIEPIPDFLLSVDENPAMLLGARIAQGVPARLSLPMRWSTSRIAPSLLPWTTGEHDSLPSAHYRKA